MSDLSDTAVLLLTCSDFEAMELVVDRLLRTTPQQVPIYILSNCCGLPGSEVCEDMASMAAKAHFGRVRWINPEKQRPAYRGIDEAIKDHIDETYIVKFDDDVFPVKEGWLEALAECYHRQDPDKIAYVTGMVNNNPYGFSRLVTLPELAAKFAAALPHRHAAGLKVPQYDDYRISEAGHADPGAGGTVWQFPQLARWIHHETTLQPDRYASLISELGETRLDPSIRYSINVMYFHRDLWEEIDHGGADDEEMLNIYCHANDKDIVVRENTPFVHLYFGPQKRYIKDVLPKVRDVYGPLDAVSGYQLVEDWALFKANYTLERLDRLSAALEEKSS